MRDIIDQTVEFNEETETHRRSRRRSLTSVNKVGLDHLEPLDTLNTIIVE